MFKKITAGILATALIITGALFGVRGCLSQYDERCAVPPILYFKNDTAAILFSLIKYSETTSYSSGTKGTYKTVATHYFIQSNNAVTGEKIKATEIGTDSLVRNAEEVLGAAGNNVWVFLNGLTAFDAFTHKKVADVKTITDQNPSLVGNMPAERKYYHFNRDEATISFTARDGGLWLLNVATLKASPQQEAVLNSPHDIEIAAQKKLRELLASHISYSSMISNEDTADGQWFGLFSANETALLKTKPSFSYADQQQRRQLLTTSYTEPLRPGLPLDKSALHALTPNDFYLDGGFLLDRETGSVIQLPHRAKRLVIYKSEIGKAGKVVLSCIASNGIVLWSINTNLGVWTDWIFRENHLFVFGSNNNKLSGEETNVLLSINLDSGTANSYDFFTDKRIK